MCKYNFIRIPKMQDFCYLVTYLNMSMQKNMAQSGKCKFTNKTNTSKEDTIYFDKRIKLSIINAST